MDLKEKFQILVNKMNAGQFDEVIFEATYLNKKFPQQEVFLNLLVLCHQAKGEYQKTIELLENGLKKNNKNYNFWNNLGISYHKLKEYTKAEDCFLKALEINPKFINTLNNIGTLYLELNNFINAEKHLRKAIEIKSDVLPVNFNLASTLQSLGKIEEAKVYFKKTLEINENFTRGDFGLSVLEKYEKDNDHISKMENKLKNKNLNKVDLRYLYFALGKVYEDISNYEKSFEFIKKANDLKKEFTKYDIETDKKLFKKIIDFHKSKKLKSKNLVAGEKNLIFILGMPRTGTSLVEQIISNHSEVYGAGEVPILSTYLTDYFNSDNDEAKINEQFNLYKNNYLNFISKISNLNFVTDKAPLNFKWIGIIKLIFPNSKIIFCSRDPLENSWSIYKNAFEGMFFSNSFYDIAEYYKLHNEIMRFWKDEYKSEIYEINYEDLINNSEKKIRELIDFCGLNWEDQCLEFYKNQKSIKTVSFLQARRPIYKDSLKGSEKFKKYLISLEKALKG